MFGRAKHGAPPLRRTRAPPDRQAAMTVVPLLLSAFTTVFVAELAGDKTFYSVGALATRYHWRVVLLGLTPAFALKMLAAVLLGRVIGTLPPRVVTVVSVATFVLAAVVLWRERDEPAPTREPATTARGVWAAFAMIFFTEWGDPGQLAAAALVARYGAPAVVWLAACAAMLAKSLLALTLGI